MRRQRLTTTILTGMALLVLVGNAAAFSFGGNGIKGSGDMETRSFDLDDFSEVIVGGAFDVDVTFGDYQEIKVTIDDNLWDILELEVKGDRLYIDWDESCRPDGDCRLRLTAKSLEAVTVKGAAEVDINDFEGDSFRFELSGAAELEMSGEVEDLEIHVSGAGEIDTRDLQAQHVKVRISGAGNANITATESIDARVSGVGNIKYWGDPEKERTNVSGMGHITAK